MKKSRFVGVLALVFACIAFVFLSDLPRYIKYKKGDIKEFESVAAHELQKGDLVQGIIDFTDGCIAEMETTNTTFGIKTSSYTSSRYYAVYMYNDMYILYEATNKAQYSTLDRLADECDAYYNALIEAYDKYGEDLDLSGIDQPVTTLSFTGEVKSIPSDLEAMFQEWYGDGYETDCESVMISYSDFSRFSWVIYAGIGSALLAVIMLVLLFVVRRKEKYDQQFGY